MSVIFRPCLVVLITLLVGADSACPLGWANTGSGCLKVFTQEAPFQSALNARHYCQQQGADLTSLSSPNDETLLFESITNQTLAPDISHVYIGMSDVTTEGKFYWLDNSNVTYNSLSADSLGQHFIPGDRRCVAIFSSDRRWFSNRTNIIWQLIPCCFDIYDINAVACSKPYNSTAVVSVDELSRYCVGGCPNGWHKLNSTCYLVTDLTRMLNDTMDARQECLNRGADLPNIRNQVIDIQLSYMMREAANRENASCVSVYHGLNDIRKPDSYVLLDQTPASFFRWGPNEPSNNMTPDNKMEVCSSATWTKDSVNSTAWKTVSCCTNSSIYWLACEKPENGSISVSLIDNVYAFQCIPDVNECLSNPCLNNATCYNGFLFYNCTCQYGFNGTHCETEIDYCSSIPCQHNGTCVRRIGSYTCNCLPGTTGVNCETVSDPCYSHPCFYNGTCSAQGSNFQCACPAGTTGRQCETDVNDCAPNPCNNYGTCIDKLNGFRCVCLSRFTGQVCETAISCEILPPELNNATQTNVSDTTWGFANLVTYCCTQAHYKFESMMTCETVKCMTTGWNATIEECGPHCDDLPFVENAAVGNANTAVGNTVNFTCYTGYILSDNHTSINTTCMSDGNWTTDLTGVYCELIRCPELPYWPYQSLDTRNNTYNTTVTFWCDVGYVLFDNTTARTIKCLSDGTWTADLPPCLPVVCPEITLEPHVRRNTSSNTYMTYAQYSCDDGYRMLDGATYCIILCDAGAEWSDIITDCRADRCFPLPYVANATPSSLDANYWNQSTLTCITGHRFFIDGQELKTQIMTCQQNGWWYPILTGCEPVLCPPVPTAKNIEPNTRNQLFETVVTFTCNPGCYIDSKTLYRQLKIECLETKIWNQSTIPDCWPIVCSAPPEITNGTRSPQTPQNTNYSTQITYQCDAGTKFLDGRTTKNIHCNETGFWNETEVSCKSDRCNPVNITAHSTPDTTNTSWYSNVTYRCNKGYEWKNNVTTFTIMCKPGGAWNTSFTDANDCQVKVCPEVSPMPNATTNTTDHVFDTVVDYECDIGFKYSDNSTSKSKRCTEAEVWVPLLLEECQIIHCPPLTDVENATRDSNDTYYNKIITYSCLPGYQYPDKTKQKAVTCTANATWTQYPKPCEVVFCPPLPYWTMAQFNATDNNFLSTTSYSCAEGFAFKNHRSKPGNQTVLTSTCLSSKQWSPAIQDCIALAAINADLIGKAYESPQSVPIGTVACTILCIVLALVILLDISKIIRDLTMLRNNVSGFIQNRKHNKVASSPNN